LQRNAFIFLNEGAVIIMRSNASFQILLILALLTPTASLGQATVRRNPGRLDADIPVPTVTGAAVQQDSGAIAELTAHIASVGSQIWGGMQGNGKITYGSADPTSYDATISNLGEDEFRLDAETKKGLESVRIDGEVGKVQGADGKISLIPSDIASLAIFPFELPRLNRLSDTNVALRDRGLVSIGGVELHRITYESAVVGQISGTKSGKSAAIDMYFDPTTHLLVKTASLVCLARSRPVSFLSVVTYGDYRRVSGVLIPFLYSETLEGELSRTLQLSNVQLDPALSSTYFDF
jgi:hypothetical protein